MTTGYIYFIQAASGPIKVGFTEDPVRRFWNLNVGHYEKLTFLGVIPGTREDEKTFHWRLRDSLIRGEWFHPSGTVLALARKSVPPPVQEKVRVQSCALPHERAPIETVIAQCRGNLTKAAAALGTSRRTLQLRMRELGIPQGKAGRPHKHLGD